MVWEKKNMISKTELKTQSSVYQINDLKKDNCEL